MMRKRLQKDWALQSIENEIGVIVLEGVRLGTRRHNQKRDEDVSFSSGILTPLKVT